MTIGTMGRAYSRESAPVLKGGAGTVQEVGGMDYTIIRPGGLKNEAGTGKGVLTEDIRVCGAIHREDVADLIIKALFSSKADGKVGASCPPPPPFTHTHQNVNRQIRSGEV